MIRTIQIFTIYADSYRYTNYILTKARIAGIRLETIRIEVSNIPVVPQEIP